MSRTLHRAWPGRLTVGGDKGFDTFGFVAECRTLHVVPHVAQNHNRRGGSAIDGRTTRHSGYAVSQRKRKRIEECFGWLKTIALLGKVRHRGVAKIDWIFTFACAAYNLVRVRKLMAVVPGGVSRGRSVFVGAQSTITRRKNTEKSEKFGDCTMTTTKKCAFQSVFQQPASQFCENHWGYWEQAVWFKAANRKGPRCARNGYL